MRTRGVISIDWTGAAVADRVDIGLLISTTDQIGVAAPADDLVSERGRDWLWIARFQPNSGMGALGRETFTLDLKAKRKVQELNQNYMICYRHVTGAGTLSISPFLRTLVALP